MALINYKFATTLLVAIDKQGNIVNDNDDRNLGPVFAVTDCKEWFNEIIQKTERYAYHIDKRGNKQGAWTITGLKRITAQSLAQAWLYKNKVELKSSGYLIQSNNRNIFNLTTKSGVEYNFHICRAYDDTDHMPDFFGAYMSIKDGKKFTFVMIDNVNDL